MTAQLKRPDHFNPLRFCAPLGSSPLERMQRIQEAAYYRAATRNFEPGHEVEDWLAAEHEVDVQIAMEHAYPRV